MVQTEALGKTVYIAESFLYVSMTQILVPSVSEMYQVD